MSNLCAKLISRGPWLVGPLLFSDPPLNVGSVSRSGESEATSRTHPVSVGSSDLQPPTQPPTEPWAERDGSLSDPADQTGTRAPPTQGRGTAEPPFIGDTYASEDAPPQTVSPTSVSSFHSCCGKRVPQNFFFSGGSHDPAYDPGQRTFFHAKRVGGGKGKNQFNDGGRSALFTQTRPCDACHMTWSHVWTRAHVWFPSGFRHR